MTAGAPDPLDAEARSWLDRYVSLWGHELKERGLMVGDPPRLREDFQEAVLRAWRGEVQPPVAVSPTPRETPDGKPEDCA